LTEEDVRTSMLDEAMKDPKGAGYLIDNKISAKLNIIFDVDHTLIFAFQC
jgi:hypothetical protein